MRIDLHFDAGQHLPHGRSLRDHASIHLAQIALVRMGADHQPDRRIEPGDDIDDRPLELVAIDLVELFRGRAAFVNQQHHGRDRMRPLDFGGPAIDGLDFIQELQAGDAVFADQVLGVLQDRADKGDLDALDGLDAIGRQQRLAVAGMDHVGGQIGEFGALEAAAQFAGPGRRRRRTAAVLLAQQFAAAAVEFMVSH